MQQQAAQTPLPQPNAPQHVATAQASVAQAVVARNQDVIKDEVARLLFEILQLASDLAFELAEIDDPKIMETGLYRKSREIVRKIKKLKEALEKQRR